MPKNEPTLRSIYDARHALMLLGYPQANVDQFVPIPEKNNGETGLKTIDAKISGASCAYGCLESAA
jgi:hypothetical protein